MHKPLNRKGGIMQRANILKIAVVIAVVAVFSVLCFMLWQLNRSFEPQSGARFISNFLGYML
jgi:hypothetical protein